MLAASRLVRRFAERIAVDDVSFEVQPGEVFGLLGPNGAGKTTTLRMLGGLIPPTSGEVRIEGTAIDRGTGPRLRRRIGFLTETPGLWDQLTVADNLAVYARLFGLPDVAGAVERSLRQFGLWDRRTDRAALLSKGMKQKVAVARALVHDPEIVLLDEPTANLDPQASRDVRDLLLDLRRQGRVVVVSTHNLDEIERLADRVALISTRLVAIGEPAALRRQIFGVRLRVRLAGAHQMVAALIEVAAAAGGRDPREETDGLSMIVDDPVIHTPAVIRALVLAGAEIREACDEQAPLEEVYLRLLDPKPGSASGRQL
ncbi:MAG: ABC transporter ATP-binding protein [Acidobacteriota bacterium]